MNKLSINFFVLLILLFGFCFQTFAAEVLQVSNSSILKIGDHNRNYTVKIACVEINSDSEEIAFNWLKKQLPRHTKINLKPKGSSNGVLEARVIPFNTNIDLTEQYINEGFAKNKC